MNSLFTKPLAILSLLIGGLFISPVVFTAIGGAAAIVFLRAGFWVVFSALILELFSGWPIGVIAMPLALANVAAEIVRSRLYYRSFAPSVIVLFTAVLTFLVSHIIATSIV